MHFYNFSTVFNQEVRDGYYRSSVLVRGIRANIGYDGAYDYFILLRFIIRDPQSFYCILQLWMTSNSLGYSQDRVRPSIFLCYIFQRNYMVCGFIKGLASSLYLTSYHLIEIRSSFSLFYDYVSAIKITYIGAYGGGDKRPCDQYNAICILFESTDPLDGGQLQLQPIYSMQVAFQTMNDSQISRGNHNGISSHQTLWSVQHELWAVVSIHDRGHTLECSKSLFWL